MKAVKEIHIVQVPGILVWERERERERERQRERERERESERERERVRERREIRVGGREVGREGERIISRRCRVFEDLWERGYWLTSGEGERVRKRLTEREDREHSLTSS
jgi:hypothetical protein